MFKKKKKSSIEPATIMDIALYTINYSNSKDYQLDNYKLQAELYYMQIISLALYKSLFFKENIETWDIGITVPPIQHEFSRYCLTEIPSLKSILIIGDNVCKCVRKKYNPDILNANQKNIIETVVDYFANSTFRTMQQDIIKEMPYQTVYSDKKYNIKRCISQNTLLKYSKSIYYEKFKDVFNTKGCE